MLKLRLQFGHLRQKAHSLDKKKNQKPHAGKDCREEEKGTAEGKMDSEGQGEPGLLQPMGSKSQTRLSD